MNCSLPVNGDSAFSRERNSHAGHVSVETLSQKEVFLFRFSRLRCNTFLNSVCVLCFSDENSSTTVELVDTLAAEAEDIIFYIYGELLCST